MLDSQPPLSTTSPGESCSLWERRATFGQTWQEAPGTCINEASTDEYKGSEASNYSTRSSSMSHLDFSEDDLIDAMSTISTISEVDSRSLSPCPCPATPKLPADETTQGADAVREWKHPKFYWSDFVDIQVMPLILEWRPPGSSDTCRMRRSRARCTAFLEL